MYSINQYGIIKFDNQIIPMDEFSLLYQDYLIFLNNNGSVTEVIDEEITIQQPISNIESNEINIIANNSIENILNQLQELKDQIKLILDNK